MIQVSSLLEGRHPIRVSLLHLCPFLQVSLKLIRRVNKHARHRKIIIQQYIEQARNHKKIKDKMIPLDTPFIQLLRHNLHLPLKERTAFQWKCHAVRVNQFQPLRLRKRNAGVLRCCLFRCHVEIELPLRFCNDVVYACGLHFCNELRKNGIDIHTAAFQS